MPLFARHIAADVALAPRAGGRISPSRSFMKTAKKTTTKTV
ncbi:hypothetical protein [Martelella mediterranea]|nr:hypothetical protein [Martelella mediterranea]